MISTPYKTVRWGLRRGSITFLKFPDKRGYIQGLISSSRSEFIVPKKVLMQLLKLS